MQKLHFHYWKLQLRQGHWRAFVLDLVTGLLAKCLKRLEGLSDF